MMDYNITKLVLKSVKARPALFNKNHSQFCRHPAQKLKLWREVCSEVNPQFGLYTPQKKLEFQRLVQRRWKSLRDSFWRDERNRKKEVERRKNGEQVKTRRRYNFYNKLKFLLETREGEEGDGDGEAGETEENSDDSETDNLWENEDAQNSSDSNSNKEVPIKAEKGEREICFAEEVPSSFLNVSMDMKEEEDGDKQFVLSLLPSFRKLSDKQKFEAKIGIWKVMKDVSFQED